MTERLAWRIIIVLSIVEAGAYLGDEVPKAPSQYFWDLTSYVVALDTDLPYRSTETYPFLYPPFAADLFGLARNHLFELLSISYVAAAVFFIDAFARLPMPRRFLWLFAVTAMGGMGVVSLRSGNVALLMNFTLLGAAIHAALAHPLFVQVLPFVIGVGALIKPQFALYLGLLPFVEASRTTAIVKIIAVGLAVVGVYALYAVLRPFDWNEYVEGVFRRTVVERDFGWGPALVITRFTSAPVAVYVGYGLAAFVGAALCVTAWRRSAHPVPKVGLIGLAFAALTLANPRLPLYDLYAAGVALIICCGLARNSRIVAWALAAALAINAMPWLVQEFTRNPAAWPWWMKDELITHTLGIFIPLVALSRVGLQQKVRA